MAVANSYSRSSACDATGGHSVQNVAFEWPDGSRGEVSHLLRWAGGRLLVLLFGDASPGALRRLQSLAETAPVRCVQVVGLQDRPAAREFVRDKLLRFCFAEAEDERSQIADLVVVTLHAVVLPLDNRSDVIRQHLVKRFTVTRFRDIFAGPGLKLAEWPDNAAGRQQNRRVEFMVVSK